MYAHILQSLHAKDEILTKVYPSFKHFARLFQDNFQDIQGNEPNHPSKWKAKYDWNRPRNIALVWFTTATPPCLLIRSGTGLSVGHRRPYTNKMTLYGL